MLSAMFSTVKKSAVLVLAYRRHDFLLELLSKIPKDRNIYIHIDGPKDETALEVNMTHSVARNFQNQNLPKPIQVYLQEKNLGNRLAFQDAMDWAFDLEDRLIVLEEDIRFNDEFFSFMDWSLNEYETQKNIFHINGLSTLDLFPGRTRLFESYGLWCWGFATWRDRWLLHERTTPALDIHGLKSLPVFHDVSMSKFFEEKWIERFTRLKNGTDTYDVGWNYSAWKNNAYALQPRFTFTTNIGFDDRSLHTRIRPFFLRTPQNLRNRGYFFGNIELLKFPNYFDAYSDIVQWRAPGLILGKTKIFSTAYYFLRRLKITFKSILVKYS